MWNCHNMWDIIMYSIYGMSVGWMDLNVVGTISMSHNALTKWDKYFNGPDRIWQFCDGLLYLSLLSNDCYYYHCRYGILLNLFHHEFGAAINSTKILNFHVEHSHIACFKYLLPLNCITNCIFCYTGWST